MLTFFLICNDSVNNIDRGNNVRMRTGNMFLTIQNRLKHSRAQIMQRLFKFIFAIGRNVRNRYVR